LQLPTYCKIQRKQPAQLLVPTRLRMSWLLTPVQ